MAWWRPTTRSARCIAFRASESFLAQYSGTLGPALIDTLLADLAAFIGAEAQQEDDITLVTLQRVADPALPQTPIASANRAAGQDQWQTLTTWNVPSGPGNERLVMESVAQIARRLNLPERRLDHLKTAVAEAAMNAMEHGNKYRVDLPVAIEVRVSARALAVRITDQGGGPPSRPPRPISWPSWLASSRRAAGAFF